MQRGKNAKFPSKENRAVKVECSMWFSVIADRMAWPPFFPRERKWPRLTKYTHLRVVRLRLKGNFVIIIIIIIIVHNCRQIGYIRLGYDPLLYELSCLSRLPSAFQWTFNPLVSYICGSDISRMRHDESHRPLTVRQQLTGAQDEVD